MNITFSIKKLLFPTIRIYFCAVKNWVIFLLTVLMLSLTFRDVITYTHFYINQDYIANNLCENIEVPELECNGKCYLKKSLKKNQDNTDTRPYQITDKKTNFNLFECAILWLDETDGVRIDQAFNEFLEDHYGFQYLQDIFHPPRQC